MTTILYYSATEAVLRTVAEAAAILQDRYDDAPQIRMFALFSLGDAEVKEQYLRAAAGADLVVIHRGGGDDSVPFPDEFAQVTEATPVVMAPRVGPVEVLHRRKPGAYGAGPERLVEEKTWQTRADLGNIYIEYGAYAYTADEYGAEDVDGFVRQLGRVDAAVRNVDTREVDLLSCSCQYGHLGGMVAAVEAIRGVAPVAYLGDTSDHARLTTRTLCEEMKVQLRSKVANPKWIASMQEHGYRGAGEIAQKIDRLFGWDAAAEAMDDWMYDDLARRFVQDDQVREWMEEVNPHAQLSILERLLEAYQRGMWNASPELIDELRFRYLEAEGDVEAVAAR